VEGTCEQDTVPSVPVKCREIFVVSERLVASQEGLGSLELPLTSLLLQMFVRWSTWSTNPTGLVVVLWSVSPVQ
jgi:hypothetical protein